MFLNELFNEAVMSSTVQTRAPISPGARGLAAGRFNFNVMRNAAIGDNSVSAVEILKIRLIDSGDGEQVEEIITSVAGEQNISPENLKKLFRTRYNVTPKEWLKNYMVRFLNSPKGMVSESGVDDQEELKKTFTNYKTQIITQILTYIKNGRLSTARLAIHNLNKVHDIKWPELDVIMKSLDKDIVEAKAPDVTSKPISITSSYMDNLWYYSSGGIADEDLWYYSSGDIVVVNRHRESINEWVKNNFKNDFGWSRGYVSRQDYINVANKYKTQILTQILKQIKNGHLNSARLAINTFEKCGVDWPEFDVITKSLEMPGKITESVTSSELISTTSYYMQTLWYYSLGKWLDGPVSVRRRQESLEKWLQENFKNLRRVKAKDDYDPRESDHLYYVSRQDYINVANKYKTQILTQILTEIKNGVHHVTGVEMAINDFKICGINWPELDVIMKSLKRDITEGKELPVNSFALRTLWLLATNTEEKKNLYSLVGKSWVEKNFEIRDDNVSKKRYTKIADKYKKNILTKLFNNIKKGNLKSVDNIINDLESGGVMWRELQIIKKSLRMKAGKIKNEHKNIQNEGIHMFLNELFEEMDDSKSEWTSLPLQDYANIMALYSTMENRLSRGNPEDFAKLKVQEVAWLKKNFDIVFNPYCNQWDICKWMKGAFNIDIDWSPVPAVIPKNLISGINQKIVTMANANKKTIITNILNYIRHNGVSGINYRIEFLKRVGVNWPELDIIKKSLVTESSAYSQMISESDIRIINLFKLSHNLGAFEREADIELWFKNNFPNPLIGYGGTMFISGKMIADYANKNKKILVRNLLVRLKASVRTGPYATEFVKDLVTSLKGFVDWPELDIIKKSLDNSKNGLTEELDKATGKIIAFTSNLAWTLCKATTDSDLFSIQDDRDLKQWFDTFDKPETYNNEYYITDHQFIEYANSNKKTIIQNLLKRTKDAVGYDDMIDYVLDLVTTLKDFVSWPELDIIKKSLEIGLKMNVNESLVSGHTMIILVCALSLVYSLSNPGYNATFRGQNTKHYIKWLKSNFDIIYGPNRHMYAPNGVNIIEKITGYLESNKKTVLKSILTDLPENAPLLNLNNVNVMRKFVKWPELDVIENSIKLDIEKTSNLTENSIKLDQLIRLPEDIKDDIAQLYIFMAENYQERGRAIYATLSPIGTTFIDFITKTFDIYANDNTQLFVQPDLDILNKKISDITNSNKKLIITNLFKKLKDSPDAINCVAILRNIHRFKKYVQWPELDLIEKSLRKNLNKGLTENRDESYYRDLVRITNEVPHQALESLYRSIMPYQYQDKYYTDTDNYNDWVYENFNVTYRSPGFFNDHSCIEYYISRHDLQNLPSDLRQFANRYKKTIILNILSKIKKHTHPYDLKIIENDIETIDNYGNLNWPELKVILKSLRKLNVPK